MAEALKESNWTAFTKKLKLDLDDTALTKALGKVEKGDESKPEAYLEVLQDLIQQIPKQVAALTKRKKELGDKVFGEVKDKLYAILEEAESREKDAKARAKEAAKAAETEEEEDAPDLLTGKMIPLMRLVRKGEVMQTLVAYTGKQTAVLMMRRAISPARRKLLTEYMGVSSAKFFKGEVSLGAGNVFLFSLETSGGGGLAKGIRQALMDQTDMRAKVKLRAMDTGEEEDDGEEGGDADGGDQARKETTDDALARRFEQRYAALEPEVLAALKANGPDAGQLRATQTFANGKAEAGDYVAALTALDKLEELLRNVGGDVLKRRFEDRFKDLEPRAQKAIADGGPLTMQLGAVLKFTNGKADAEDYAAALKSLDKLEELLNPPKPKPSRGGAGMDPAAAFTARLSALMPSVQKSIARDGPEAAEVKAKTASAGAAAKRGEYDGAHEILDMVEELIARAQNAGSSDTPDAQWVARVASVQRQLDRVMQADATEGAKLEKVMALARDRAAAGEHAKASAALDQLMKLIAAFDARPAGSGADGASQGAGAAGEAGYKGLVKYRASLVEFNMARSTVKNQLADLKRAIPDQMPDESDLADELAETLEDFASEIQDAVDRALNQSKDPKDPVPKEIVDRIIDLQSELDSNELVKHVDSNPFGVKVSVGDTLGKALKAVRDNLPTPA